MNKRPTEANLQFLIGRLGILLVFLYLALGALIYASLDSWEERAHFGNMFGAVNALFTALALAGAIGAIYLQQRDLDNARANFQEQLNLLRRESERRHRISLKKTQLLVEETTPTRTEQGNAKLINRGGTATAVILHTKAETSEGEISKRVPLWRQDQEITFYGPRNAWGTAISISYLDESALKRTCHLSVSGTDPLEETTHLHEVELAEE